MSPDHPTDSGNIIESVGLLEILQQYDEEYIDLLKMDIEGGEKDVFRENYLPWLSKTRVAIIEIHAHVPECRNLVQKAFSEAHFKEISFHGDRTRCGVAVYVNENLV